MGRIIGGLVAGVVAAFAAIWAIQLVGHFFYPVPSDLSIGNREQLAAFVRGLPAGAQAFVVAAWLGGALVGGTVAYRISRRRWSAWAIAAVVAFASILNILMIPHPEWMQIGAVAAPLLGGLLASHLGRPRTEAGNGAP